MKYCDKVVGVDDDGVNYKKGYRLELTSLELSLLVLALDFASNFDENNDDSKSFRELSENLAEIEDLSEKGLTNFEL